QTSSNGTTACPAAPKPPALTFLPPLISCLLFPTGFVTASRLRRPGGNRLDKASSPPCCSTVRAKKFGAGKTYKVYGGLWLMVWVFLFGIVNIAAQVLSQMELVPVFKG
ncbi:hypothetical protein FKR44_12510, partial [Neisseria meningitidis]|nr:hypothetical protein [Neisseria meningitidis]